MRDDSAFLRPVALVALALLALLVLAAGAFYLQDGKVQATVQDTDCGGIGRENSVDVTTRFLGIDHTVTGLPFQTCLTVRPGNFVDYHVRSQRTILYESEGGPCIYDSETGVC